MKRICLAGNGWGAISALKSLQVEYSSLFVVSDDKELLLLLRKQDIQLANFENENFDLVICAGYKPIIKKKSIDNKKIINIHYSLLPKYRGMHSTVWAILNGEKELGLTVYEMNEFIDDGDIIYQYSTLYKGQTATQLMECFNEHIQKNLAFVVRKYLNQEIILKPQDKTLASWVCKRNEDDCLINFSWTVKYLHRFFKALTYPYPIPFFYYKEKKLRIEKYQLIENNTVMTVGRIVNIDEEGIWIQISGGYLVASTLLDEKNNEFPISCFRIGYRL